MRTQDYSKKQEMAREIEKSVERECTGLSFEVEFERMGKFLDAIKKLGVFASQVADTVEKTMNPYSNKVARISSKQAWILACAAVENNIEFAF